MSSTRKTVLAGRIGPASRRSGPRRVLVSCAESLTGTDQPEIDAALGALLRPEDTVLLGARPDAAIRFAERHGLMVDHGASTRTADLVVAVLDPLMPHGHGNALPLNALEGARREAIDHVAVEARSWPRAAASGGASAGVLDALLRLNGRVVVPDSARILDGSAQGEE